MPRMNVRYPPRPGSARSEVLWCTLPFLETKRRRTGVNLVSRSQTSCRGTSQAAHQGTQPGIATNRAQCRASGGTGQSCAPGATGGVVRGRRGHAKYRRIERCEGGALTTERYPMNLAQLLGRQCWAEILVPLANHRQHRSPQRRGLAPIAAATAALRDQARRTRGPVRFQQPEHLTALEPQQLRRRFRRQAPLIQTPQHSQPHQLPIAHQSNRHPQHPPDVKGAPGIPGNLVAELVDANKRRFGLRDGDAGPVARRQMHRTPPKPRDRESEPLWTCS